MAGDRPGRLGRLLGSFTGSMEMPREVMLDVPRVTLIGDLQAQIENHRGVLEYTPDRVRIRTRAGVLTVTGSLLKIGSIFRDEVVIDGRIRRVELEAAAGDGAGEREKGSRP